MRALVFKSPWEMAVEEREIRDPHPGEVLIKIVATGVCGSDLHGFTGHTGRRHPEQVMGHETVGTVIGMGDGVSGLQLEQSVVVNPAMSCGKCPQCELGEEQRCTDLRVLGVYPEWDAAFAEYMVVPAANLIPLPPQTPTHLGALAEPLAVGWHAVRRARLAPDERVVVIGGGPIGQAVALGVKRAGIDVITVTENLSSRRDLLRRLGFHAVAPDEASDVLGALPSQPTTVFDAVGTSQSVAQGLNMTGRGGRLVLIGMAEPQINFAAFDVSVQERDIIGTFCYSKNDFVSTVEWLSANIDIAEQLVDAVEPLEAGPTVFQELASHSRDASKILLSPNI